MKGVCVDKYIVDVRLEGLRSVLVCSIMAFLYSFTFAFPCLKTHVDFCLDGLVLFFVSLLLHFLFIACALSLWFLEEWFSFIACWKSRFSVFVIQIVRLVIVGWFTLCGLFVQFFFFVMPCLGSLSLPFHSNFFFQFS